MTPAALTLALPELSQLIAHLLARFAVSFVPTIAFSAKTDLGLVAGRPSGFTRRVELNPTQLVEDAPLPIREAFFISWFWSARSGVRSERLHVSVVGPQGRAENIPLILNIT
jgi:hypothetical protein